MRLAILLLCTAVGFSQSTSPTSETKTQTPANSSDQKPKNNDLGLGSGAQGRQFWSLDILSDTQGVDFGPYLQRILQDVRENWYHLIPTSASMKRGKLAIEFAITKDGRIADMRLVASSGDKELDRPAWGSIAASNPFPPLPGEFKGRYLALRFRFYYNPDKSDLGLSHSGKSDFASSPSGTTVTILLVADLQVSAGGSEVVSATVTGTKERAVEWSIKGPGCSGSACGKMVGDLYVAPTVLPNPPEVILTATSKADPTAKASVTVHIVQPAAQTSSKP
jgi:TonB family protein